MYRTGICVERMKIKEEFKSAEHIYGELPSYLVESDLYKMGPIPLWE